jgi:hypothetical protein
MMQIRALIAIAVAVCIAAVGLFTVYDLNGGSFDLSDRQLMLIVTDSMDGDVTEYEVDSFPANTLVMIEHIPDHEIRFLRVGQVLSYHDGPVLVHHRIIQVNDDSFYVKGDNGHSTDKVMFSDVNGVVVGANHWMGSALAWLSDNFLLFLGIMFVLCCAIILRCTLGSRPDEEVQP